MRKVILSLALLGLFVFVGSVGADCPPGCRADLYGNCQCFPEVPTGTPYPTTQPYPTSAPGGSPALCPPAGAVTDTSLLDPLWLARCSHCFTRTVATSTPAWGFPTVVGVLTPTPVVWPTRNLSGTPTLTPTVTFTPTPAVTMTATPVPLGLWWGSQSADVLDFESMHYDTVWQMYYHTVVSTPVVGGYYDYTCSPFDNDAWWCWGSYLAKQNATEPRLYVSGAGGVLTHRVCFYKEGQYGGVYLDGTTRSSYFGDKGCTTWSGLSDVNDWPMSIPGGMSPLWFGFSMANHGAHPLSTGTLGHLRLLYYGTEPPQGTPTPTPSPTATVRPWEDCGTPLFKKPLVGGGGVRTRPGACYDLIPTIEAGTWWYFPGVTLCTILVDIEPVEIAGVSIPIFDILVLGIAVLILGLVSKL